MLMAVLRIGYYLRIFVKQLFHVFERSTFSLRKFV